MGLLAVLGQAEGGAVVPVGVPTATSPAAAAPSAEEAGSTSRPSRSPHGAALEDIIAAKAEGKPLPAPAEDEGKKADRSAGGRPGRRAARGAAPLRGPRRHRLGPRGLRRIVRPPLAPRRRGRLVRRVPWPLRMCATAHFRADLPLSGLGSRQQPLSGGNTRRRTAEMRNRRAHPACRWASRAGAVEEPLLTPYGPAAAARSPRPGNVAGQPPWRGNSSRAWRPSAKQSSGSRSRSGAAVRRPPGPRAWCPTGWCSRWRGGRRWPRDSPPADPYAASALRVQSTVGPVRRPPWRGQPLRVRAPGRSGRGRRRERRLSLGTSRPHLPVSLPQTLPKARRATGLRASSVRGCLGSHAIAAGCSGWPGSTRSGWHPPPMRVLRQASRPPRAATW